MTIGRVVGAFALASALLVGGSGCAGSGVELVRRFNDAVDRGDLESARAMLAPDAKVWYENPLSEGSPYTLSGDGRYKTWDAEFRSRKTVLGDYQQDGPWVWVVCDETNDYYRLTERNWARVYMAWKVDEQRRVAGMLVAAVGEPRSRAKEFRAWAAEHDKAECEYLFPGGTMDVTGDRAARMRRLLNRWREAVGLAPIEQ